MKAGCILSSRWWKVNRFPAERGGLPRLYRRRSVSGGLFFVLGQPLFNRLDLVVELDDLVPAVVDRQVGEDAGNTAAEGDFMEKLRHRKEGLGVAVDDGPHVGD